LRAGGIVRQATTSVLASRASMRVEAARASDLPGIRWLLEYEHLPSEDVTEQLLAHFLVCRDERGVVGAVAIEPFGNLVLLRSLVVEPEFRGEGLAASWPKPPKYWLNAEGRRLSTC
jgi:GNAT superfamily N-acetyltransferase